MCSENLSCFRRQLLCIRCHVFALKTAQTGRRMRQATLAAPRGEKVKFGPYRQKKTLEASASRVVVEHRGVEPLTSTMRMLGKSRLPETIICSKGCIIYRKSIRISCSVTIRLSKVRIHTIPPSSVFCPINIPTVSSPISHMPFL